MVDGAPWAFGVGYISCERHPAALAITQLPWLAVGSVASRRLQDAAMLGCGTLKLLNSVSSSLSIASRGINKLHFPHLLPSLKKAEE